MQLAKPALDVGLYTNQLDPMLAFWQEQVQLPYSEMLPLGGGARQHRHAIGASVLKINHSRQPIETGTPTGLACLTVYTDLVDEPVELLDPDGNQVVLAPPSGPANLCLQVNVNDLQRSTEFYRDVLQLPTRDHRVTVGDSSIQLTPGTVAPIGSEGIGYRYMTVQVYDVVNTHAGILQRGGRESMPPTRLGDVAHISFVIDPDGNRIEISQRKSITGSLD